jgi:hypothetical protein
MKSSQWQYEYSKNKEVCEYRILNKYKIKTAEIQIFVSSSSKQ